jgi:aryl-alcohol dehydrogenase-like predicted oxidoreductase
MRTDLPRSDPPLNSVRILNGMWQVSGAHGVIDPKAAIETMIAHHEAGLTTWDLADHYGPAEDLIGAFRHRLAGAGEAAALDVIQAFTKWVPRPGPMTRSVAEAAIARSLRRMDVETLDLLQFHWWDYDDERYLEALDHLAALRDEGQIRQLGLTNFDTAHLDVIMSRGIPIVSNQIQYSLVDRRPEVHMAEFCRTHGVQLLCYGALCGGLMSERFLGHPEPGRSMLDTVSLQKYKQMIDAWGGWTLFQELLTVLKDIADKHRASIANVAVRAILDQPAVGGVVVGVRLGLSNHLDDNLRAFEIRLDADDHDRIQAVTTKSRDLYRVIGDCGDEYRR